MANGEGPPTRAKALQLRMRMAQARANLSQSQTIQQRTEQALGLDTPSLERRSTFLPFSRARTGEDVLAFPQVAVDIAQAMMMPGFVAQGGRVAPSDVTRAALDVGAPALTRIPRTSRTVQSRREFIEAAPTTQQIKRQAIQAKNAATGSGVLVKEDSFLDFMGDLETKLAKNKLNRGLHKDSTAALSLLNDQIGKELDVEDLIVIRRNIGDAARSVDPNKASDRRIANIMMEDLDDYVAGLKPEDLAAGDPLRLSGNLSRFRQQWSRMKKAELLEGVISDAETQASGFENGLRIGMRRILRSPRLVRGFTGEERRLMQQIVKGSNVQNALRLLGKAAFSKGSGTNFLGGSIATAGGAAAGGSLGGPAGAAIGSVLAPAAGALAQRGAEASTLRQAQLLRALAATGGQLPRSTARRGIAEALARVSGPVVGTQIPQEPQVIRGPRPDLL